MIYLNPNMSTVNLKINGINGPKKAEIDIY